MVFIGPTNVVDLKAEKSEPTKIKKNNLRPKDLETCRPLMLHQQKRTRFRLTNNNFNVTRSCYFSHKLFFFFGFTLWFCRYARLKAKQVQINLV